LLPHKIDGRMYNPLGKWTGWYFSEEVKLAETLGYNIIVHYGYKFERISNVFNSFINKYFSIKAGLSNIVMDRTLPVLKWKWIRFELISVMCAVLLLFRFKLPLFINIKNIDMHISSINLKRKQVMIKNRISHTFSL
jgi:hypothetical protein